MKYCDINIFYNFWKILLRTNFFILNFLKSLFTKNYAFFCFYSNYTLFFSTKFSIWTKNSRRTISFVCRIYETIITGPKSILDIGVRATNWNICRYLIECLTCIASSLKVLRSRRVTSVLFIITTHICDIYSNISQENIGKHLLFHSFNLILYGRFKVQTFIFSF